MKRGRKRFLCLALVLCMMSGCASPADKGAKETVTPSKPIEEIVPTGEPAGEVTPVPTVAPTAKPTEEPAVPTPTPVMAAFVPENPEGDAVILADKSGAAPVYIDANGPAFAGLRLIADAVAGDIEAVTGQKPVVVNTEPEEGIMIIAGLVDEEIITKEGLTWEITPSNEDFKSADFERYQIQVKKDGDKTKVIVAGADKRGTIYGLFHITQDLCGVSPWIWWADAKPAHQDVLSFEAAELEVTSKRPSVNYRGFFLNDENPALDGFADSHFGGLNYMFYSHVFELMLRLKGNYLWPAMWSNSFNLDGMEGVEGKFTELEKEYHYMLNGVMHIDSYPNDVKEYRVQNINRLYGEKVPEVKGGTEDGCLGEGSYPMYLANAVLADFYGVMIGASHHEPMARAGAEWGRFKGTYYSQGEEPGAKSGAWNYYQNVENISNFWSDSIARNGNFSNNLYTVGMRGENDTALTDASGKKLTLAENAQMLKDILVKQDSILQKFNQGDTTRLLCLYKEVETCWYGGNRNNPSKADDSFALRKDPVVQEMLGADTNNIVMFCEDNNGYLRTLGEYGEKDDYNYGLYYHFDYVGGPKTSMWINTMPLQRTWDNMTTAYEYGVDDAWIVNVGDLKPMELPMTYFLDLAYDFETYGSSNPNSVEEYTKNWVRQQFAAGNLSEEEVAEVAAILTGYTDMNGAVKPESLFADTYSVLNYNEVQRHLKEAIELEELADKYLARFENTELYDAYYELVYYPAAATANLNKLWMYMALNQQYAKRGSMLANVYGKLVEEALDVDRALTATYNTLGGDLNGKDKWYRMMVSAPGNGEKVAGLKAHAHMAYNSWNHESSMEIIPATVEGTVGSRLIVDVAGDEKGYSSGTVSMPGFYNLNKEAHALTLSNGGGDYLFYEITDVPEWVIIDGQTEGGFYVSRVLGVSVDWNKVTKDTEGSFKIISGDQTVTVEVTAKVMTVPEDIHEKAAFVLDGMVSIVADNYTDKGASADGTRWQVMENYGKTGATLKMFPVYTDDYEIGTGPWVEYQVYIPDGEPTGEYRITGFFGQSNNISFNEGNHFNIGIQVNDGMLKKVNTLDGGYIAGDSHGWNMNILLAGHTMSLGNVGLKEGVNIIRIYGMDQNVMLQKLVLVSGNAAPKDSFAGPEQSYYAGMGEVARQALVCYQAEDIKYLPGSVLAKDCLNVGATVTDGSLAAVPGMTYVYGVTVTEESDYVFGVTGSSEQGAVVTVQAGDCEPLEFTLGNEEGTVSNEKPVRLLPGYYEIEVTVTEAAMLCSVMAEMFDDTQGRPLQVECTGGDEKNAKKAVDRKSSSAWEPGKSNPTLTLDLGEIAYADYFVLSGNLTKIYSYKLEVSEDGDNWTTVYSEDGTPVSGSRVYFQGTEAYRGSKWRFTFYGTLTALNEVELHTYMNWTMEAEKTYTTGGNNPDRPSSDPAKTADGNRIGHPKNRNGFIADVGSNMTITFTKAYPMTGIMLSGMQRSVDDNSDGVIPDDMLTSDRAPASYTISYQTEDGNWVSLGTLDTAGKVLTYFEFAEGNEVNVQAIKIHMDGWARLMEAEAVQMIDYTLNGGTNGQ
ncbi:MAG: glycosyl hydrolase 115 family protein [Lachnospiraceae bacterium]|nr:glycosyl hydrolase 115 family protein [Lachnospiraceae bacterium]